MNMFVVQEHVTDHTWSIEYEVTQNGQEHEIYISSLYILSDILLF